MFAIKQNYSIKEIVLVGYIGFILFDGLSLMLMIASYGLSNSLPIGLTNEMFLWNIFILLCMPPLLSVLFYKITMVFRDYGALLATLVGAVFFLGIFLAELLSRGLFNDLVTYSSQFYIYLSTLGILLGFFSYSMWILGIGIYQRYIMKNI